MRHVELSPRFIHKTQLRQGRHEKYAMCQRELKKKFSVIIVFLLTFSLAYLYLERNITPIKYSNTRIGNSWFLQNCKDMGRIISIQESGRLGNLMSEFATLHAYTKLYPHHSPVISEVHLGH